MAHFRTQLDHSITVVKDTQKTFRHFAHSLSLHSSQRAKRFLAALLNFGLGIFNTFQISSIQQTQNKIVLAVNATQQILAKQEAILEDVAHSLTAQAAFISDMERTFIKTDLLLSANSNLLSAYTAVFLGFQAIIGHQFPTTLVAPATIKEQLDLLYFKAEHNNLFPIFADTAFVTQANIQFFSENQIITVITEIPLAPKSHRAPLLARSFPPTLLNYHNSIWLLNSTSVALSPPYSDVSITSLSLHDFYNCPTIRSLRICYLPTIKMQSSCPAAILRNRGNLTDCLGSMSAPHDPTQFVVNHTVNHFSTKPVPYFLHCPHSNSSHSLIGSTRIEVPVSCSFFSNILRHSHSPDISQIHQLQSNEVRHLPALAHSLFAILDLPDTAEQLEEFWTNHKDALNDLTEDQRKLSAITKKIKANTLWNRFFAPVPRYLRLRVFDSRGRHSDRGLLQRPMSLSRF